MAQKYCDRMHDKVIEQRVFIATLGKGYKSAAFESLLYKSAFDICCMKCTCGTPMRAFDEAFELILAAAQAAQASLNEDDEDDEDETDGLADDER